MIKKQSFFGELDKIYHQPNVWLHWQETLLFYAETPAVRSLGQTNAGIGSFRKDSCDRDLLIFQTILHLRSQHLLHENYCPKCQTHPEDNNN